MSNTTPTPAARVLRALGFAFTGGGIICAIVGGYAFISMVMNFGPGAGNPSEAFIDPKIFLLHLGGVLIPVGVALLIAGYFGAISRYFRSEWNGSNSTTPNNELHTSDTPRWPN